jgi:hypothetical protein
VRYATGKIIGVMEFLGIGFRASLLLHYLASASALLSRALRRLAAFG